MAFWVLLSVLVLLHNTGGLLGAKVRSSIVDGKKAKPNAWKWMAYLELLNGQNEKWNCGATILSERWVMSAKSCWDAERKPVLKKITLSVGLIDLENGADQFIGIDREPVYHETADLVLLITEDPIKMNGKVGVMTLPHQDSLGESSQCWIIGWGDVSKGTPLEKPKNLHQRPISIISNKDCKVKLPKLGSKELCAKDYACDGDYGGPLVCKQGNDFVQVGIMSSGECNPDGPPGVYTPVYEYSKWIRERIKIKPEM